MSDEDESIVKRPYYAARKGSIHGVPYEAGDTIEVNASGDVLVNGVKQRPKSRPL